MTFTFTVEVLEWHEVIAGSAHAAVAVVRVHADVMATAVVNLALVVKDDRSARRTCCTGSPRLAPFTLDTCV